MELTISVAIASYNGARHIGEQLASIAAQTLLPDEVVVSDDGSTDDTPAIVEAFAATAPFPVRLIRQPRQLGILENFYSAFQACRSTAIAYCDQDDVWRPDKLARQAAMLGEGVMLAIHPSEVVDGDLVPLGRVEPANPRTGTLAAPFDAQAIHAFGHQMLFRRAVLDLMLGLREAAGRISRDRLETSFDPFVPFCASLLGGIAIDTEPLTRFRRHAGATTGAGLHEASAEGLRARAARAIDRDERFAEDGAGIVAEALRLKLVPAQAAERIRRAMQRKAARARAQRQVLEGGSKPSRLLRLVPALAAAARPTGFSNDRPVHAAKLSLAAALGS